MESTGSSTRSTAPAADSSLQSLAILRDEGSKLAQESSEKKAPAFKCAHCHLTFSTAVGRGGHQKVHRNLFLPVPPPPPSSPEFKCQHCPRTFPSARRLAGHQTKHRDVLKARDRQIEKERRRRLAPAGPQVFNSYHTRMHNYPSPSFAGSGVVPFFAGTGTGGLAPAQPSSAATGGGGHVGSGSHVGISRQVNQKETAQYFSWLRTSAVPSFLSQTGSGLPRPSFAAPAPVAQAEGRNGDGVHLGGQQETPEVNQEETADGIDLTLRL